MYKSEDTTDNFSIKYTKRTTYHLVYIDSMNKDET